MSKFQVQIPEELLDIAPGYLAKRVRDLATLKDALTRKDFDFICKLSHKTKGTAGGYGFHGLGIIAKSLEIAGKSGSIPAAESALTEMQDYLENVQITN